jgi:hypothetical protein
VGSTTRLERSPTTGVIPGQTGTSFGDVLSALAIFDLGRMVWVTRGMRHHHRSREKLELTDWGWYVIYPGLATLLLARQRGTPP